MFKRHIQPLVENRLKRFPAIALVGPRQCGKTTFAKSLGGVYFDLEQESDRVSLDIKWDSLMTQSDLVILDEAQEWPVLFKRLRGAIDQDRKRNGRFLLLGSVSPALMRQVSESLAGRMALLELTPFVREELPSELQQNLWLYGGYPDGGIVDPEQYFQWQQHYLEMLVFRDLPAWGLPAEPHTTQRLLKMIAAVHGQTLNASQLGKSLDISYKTVKSYLGYLEGAFLIRQLQPFHSNLKKRLVKSSKLYWRDSGLLHTLLNIRNEEELLSAPWVGASWEGFVIEQVLNALKLKDLQFSPYFFRTNDQYEIDLVLDFGKEKWAIEIKLTSSPDVSAIGRLNKTADLIGASRRILISRTSKTVDNDKVISCNLEGFISYLVKQ
jgi:predicted AAA+ superfamily ATPase